MILYENTPKVALKDLAHDLLYDLTDIPTDVAVHYLRRSAQYIARNGDVLRRSAVIHTQRCVENYLLEPADCVDVVAIISVCGDYCGRCGRLHRLMTEPCRLECGTQTWFEAPNVIYFRGAGCGTFNVNFSVVPTADACEVDADFQTKYYELLLMGARGFAYDVPNKPWSSNPKAQECQRRFEIGIRSAKIERMTGGQRGAFRPSRPRVV